MSIFKTFRSFFAFKVILAGLIISMPVGGLTKENVDFGSLVPDASQPLSTTGEPLIPWTPMAYPSDPISDIDWLTSCGTSGVASIQCAFNNARTNENSQLGTSLSMLTLPHQSEWDSMSDGEKALWLINRERIDRGEIDPLHGIEVNVTDVAQTYADYLLNNDAWGHGADGRTPWERLEDNPAIGSCHDYLAVAENLALFVSTSAIPIPVERAVYNWMYVDAASSWGHRHTILWYPYNDNSGTAGMEGFLGIGRASGGPHTGPFAEPWPNAEIIVLNVFDPCSIWEYETTASMWVSLSSTFLS